jgi:hypothetical protein
MKQTCVAVWYLSTITVYRNIQCIHNQVLRTNRPSGLYNNSLQLLALLLFSNKAHTGSGWNEFSKLCVTNCQHADMCLCSHITSESRDRNSSVGIATRLRASQSGFRILAGTRDFSLLQTVQTGFGALPTSYSMDIRVLSRGKWVKLTTHLHLVLWLRKSEGTLPIY